MESAELPDIVYAPAHPDPRPGHRGVRFETRLLASGDPVALAFTSQPALVDALGPAQPWMALRLHRLRTLMGRAGIAQICLDATVPDDAPRWQPEDLSFFDDARE